MKRDRSGKRMSLAERHLEPSRAGDPYYDYCLWPYQPPAATEGKLRSVNLLYHSLEVAGAGERGFEVCGAVREGMGAFQTVWGVKHVDGRLGWEFYFYDYRRLERRRSIGRFLDVIAPYMACDLRYAEQRPYFMFSVELDAALLATGDRLDEINVYIGNVGSSVSSGMCYSLTEAGLELSNFYFFFDAATEMEDIAGKIAASGHLDLPGLRIKDILWPDMARCKTIVVANKKRNEAIYFSRITVGQLIVFLKRLEYPSDLVSYIEDRQDRLDHLLFDVGYDYVMRDGEIKILKSGYYGIL